MYAGEASVVLFTTCHDVGHVRLQEAGTCLRLCAQTVTVMTADSHTGPCFNQLSLLILPLNVSSQSHDSSKAAIHMIYVC